MVPSEPTRTVRVNSGASYTVIPTRSLFPIFSTGRLEPSLKDVAPVPARLGFACGCAETELAKEIASREMAKHFINDYLMQARGILFRAIQCHSNSPELLRFFYWLPLVFSDVMSAASCSIFRSRLLIDRKSTRLNSSH